VLKLRLGGDICLLPPHTFMAFTKTTLSFTLFQSGSPMVWAVTGRSLTAGAGVQYQACACRISGLQRGSTVDFSTSNAVFRRQHHSNISPYSYIHLPMTLNDLRKSESRKGNTPKNYTPTKINAHVMTNRTTIPIGCFFVRIQLCVFLARNFGSLSVKVTTGLGRVIQNNAHCLFARTTSTTYPPCKTVRPSILRCLRSGKIWHH